jgi:excinuclease ABC subunit C
MDSLMHSLFTQSAFVDFGPSLLHIGAEAPGLHGVCGQRSAVLRRGVRQECPAQPGVYGMIDLAGDLIYVGKAKNLRGRLLTYFRPRSRDPKAGRILVQTRRLVWEKWPDEFGALHRELELIRRWRPRCNVLAKPHGRQHTYICLGRSPAPYAFLARRPPARIMSHYGPILAGPAARAAVRGVNDEFQLRDCPQAQEMIFANQAELFPRHRDAGCLRADLGTCLGPCAARCTQDAYSARVRAAAAFLAGRDQAPLVRLQQDMALAAAQQQYERAAALRDKWKALTWLHQQLERSRQAEAMGVSVYPVRSIEGDEGWYVLYHGRAIAAARPTTEQAHLDEIHRVAQERGRAARPADHIAGVLLASAWFRRRPAEKARLLNINRQT